MPKLLIIDSTLVNFGDDAGGQHVDAGETHDVPKDPARQLVAAGRALYVNRDDDPTRGALNTASEAQLKAAAALVAARAKAQKV
jgi:hypothetical protein